MRIVHLLYAWFAGASRGTRCFSTLHQLRQSSLLWLPEQQMHMLRHRDVAHDVRRKPPLHLFQNLQEEIARTYGSQQCSPLVAAEGDKVQITLAMIAFQLPRHNTRNPHPFPNPERVGHPPSIIPELYTEMVSFATIMPTLKSQAQRVSHPPVNFVRC